MATMAVRKKSRQNVTGSPNATIPTIAVPTILARNSESIMDWATKVSPVSSGASPAAADSASVDGVQTNRLALAHLGGGRNPLLYATLGPDDPIIKKTVGRVRELAVGWSSNY